MRNIRIFETLTFIHTGLGSAIKAMNCSPKERVSRLEQAVDEIKKGLTVLEKELEESKSQSV